MGLLFLRVQSFGWGLEMQRFSASSWMHLDLFFMLTNFIIANLHKLNYLKF
jgi:hypothetical protein